jgi:hypothetical protein
VKRKPSIFVLAALLLFFSQTANAQNRPPSFPRLEPDPKALEFYSLGARASGYTWAEYAQISLWASGDNPTATLDRIRAAADALNSSRELPTDRREKAEFVLTYMHSNILRSYSLYQTRVDTIFSNGRYNCVSSAVLYMILCESAGINTSAVVTRDHAFVIVHIDDQNIDVETTNRYGFDPGSRREFHDNFGTLTGFTYVPAHNYRDRRTISKIELISLIFINRIADHERQNHYADSVPVAIDRAALLLGAGYSSTSQIDNSESLFEDPRKVVMDRLFNYGASLLRANREEDGILWATAASARYANSERWQEFFEAAVNNRIARFLKERDVNVGAARNFLEDKKNILTAVNYAQLDTIIVDAELLKRANQIRGAGDGDAVISDTLNARENGRLPERRANELIVYAVQKTASVLCAAPARDWRAAINYIEAFISRFGERLGANRELDQALRTYRGNLATDYHNRFAAEWNRRNYDEAERILNEGLAEFPDNRQLLTDRETVNRNRPR